MKKELSRGAAQALSFKVGWAISLFAAGTHQTWLSLLTAVVGWSAAWALLCEDREQALARSLAVVAYGFAMESLNMHLGLYSFPENSLIPPVWLLSFWPLVAILFFDFLRVFDRVPLLLQWVVCMGAALGYGAGASMGLIQFHGTWAVSLGIFCGVWSAEFTALMWLERRWRQGRQSSTTS